MAPIGVLAAGRIGPRPIAPPTIGLRPMAPIAVLAAGRSGPRPLRPRPGHSPPGDAALTRSRRRDRRSAQGPNRGMGRRPNRPATDRAADIGLRPMAQSGY